jgi:hypothetical protein
MEKMTSGVGGDLKAAFIFASDYLKTVCKGAAVAVTKRCAVSGGVARGSPQACGRMTGCCGSG